MNLTKRQPPGGHVWELAQAGKTFYEIKTELSKNNRRMNMIITKEFLIEKKACEPSLAYVCENGYIGLEADKFVRKLIAAGRFSDTNWLLTKIFTKEQNVRYAVFAAEQVLPFFEKKYPDDLRPRNAIEMAKKYLNTDAAAYAAYTDAAAAYADAAYAAADAAKQEMQKKIYTFGLKILRRKNETNNAGL